MGYASAWRNTNTMADDALAELIRRDGIDVLVDMAGHTSQRMRVLARKPAPVQITHFGYPNTTGVRTMDWRVTDRIADPPGMTEGFYTERLMRLDGCAWCYQADEGSPDVGPLPAAGAGHVTFGSFNNAVKVTAEVVDLWSEILRATPRSKLVLLSASPTYDNRERIAREFTRHGIAGDRLTLMPRVGRAEYLAQHSHVDICIDTFPYTGGVTTLDALWMGVPVLTLAGRTHVARVGASMMTFAGMPDLVASTRDQYVELAVALASDAQRLRTLRSNLRQQMRSTLANSAAYARRFEEALFTSLSNPVGAK
jgi:predicted O-linked N-acetylglucosamine transferase (SPINDLY family)